jgi:hypothetical protein
MICELAISTVMSSGRLSATRGESDAAHFVAEQARQGWNQAKGSHSLGLGIGNVFEELYDVAASAALPNWDGYGGLPVTQESYLRAYCFLDSLPLGMPLPSIGVDPDGQLTFEWYRNPRRTLSVSVSAEGDLHYAALVGRKKEFGTEVFIGEFPERFITLVGQVCA